MDDEPDTPEEITEAIISSVTEVHIIDNGDGTCTMNFVLGSKEISAVFAVSLRKMFGETLNHIVSNDLIDQYVNTGIVIPNSLEEQ